MVPATSGLTGTAGRHLYVPGQRPELIGPGPMSFRQPPVCTGERNAAGPGSLAPANRTEVEDRPRMLVSRLRMTPSQLWALALTSTASFMIALDSTVVTTALSTIRHDLGASVATLEWTVNAYIPMRKEDQPLIAQPAWPEPAINQRR